MNKQLNIRSDEAYDLAHRLARAERKSVARVVTEALRIRAQTLEPREDIFSEAAVAERQAALHAIIQRQRRFMPKDFTTDHSDLYDEDGLPK